MPNSMQYDKPFKTYDELIDLMESRNIEIKDRDFTRMVLSSLSYYTIINGYKNTFLAIPGSDHFVKGTTFENLYTLHIIDTSLNSIVLKYILFVERYLKTRISYLISQKYGVYTDSSDMTNTNPADYLCQNNYGRNARGRNNILKSIKGSLSSDRINTIVAHYASAKNHIPPWILSTNISLGMALKWYSILKPEDKEDICNQFLPTFSLSIEEKKEFLTAALNLLREFRNQIAHGNRTFSIHNLPVLPKKSLLELSFQTINVSEYNSGFGKNDMFAVVLICFILIDDRYLLNNFLSDLNYVLNPYSGTPMNGKNVFEIFKLPANLNDRLTLLLSNRF